jgi:hypothetical protein
VEHQPSGLQGPPTDFADRVVLLPARALPCVPDEVPAQSAARVATVRRPRARTRIIRQVAVIEVAGPLSEVIEELDRAIQMALAEAPRGVVCDLSDVLEVTGPVALEVLATAGRHVRDWPGTAVAVACPDHRVREYLRAHPLGGHLILTASLFSAISEVLASPTIAVERLHLAAHPTAARASRDFVTRTLLDWRLGRVIPFASLVVSELVVSSSMCAGSDMDLSVVWNLGALRLTVRDHGPALLGQSHRGADLGGRGLSVVAGLSRALGVLLTDDGGEVVWAVLDAPRPRLSTRRMHSARIGAAQESPVFTDGLGLAELPFCAGSSLPPVSDLIRPRQGRDQTFAG